MVRRIVIVLAALAALACLAPASAGAADLFGKPTEQSGDRPTATTVDQLPLPAFLRPIVATAAAWQTKMNAAMRAQLLAARSGASIRPALIIVLFAFLYGVAHAVGPGHGKVVVGSYFLTNRARIAQGLAMSGVAALVQAISAVVLVGLLAVLFDTSSSAILDRAADIEIASYGAIAAIGLWMAWGILSGREHDHGHGHGDADGHGHGHEDHSHAPTHGQPRQRQRGAKSWRRLLLTGAAVGLRPCSGAILVLLFSLANGIFGIGVVATFAMAAGVAIAVSTVSLAALALHRSAGAAGRPAREFAARGYSVAALIGALMITVFGVAELVGVWTGVLSPSAG
jgi:ABC-type nickel/cobalt efflux system permease component RcnA